MLTAPLTSRRAVPLHHQPLKHRRYPWETQRRNILTVCIAALADVGKSLVLACDSMLSSAEFSGDEIAHKLYPLSDRFHWAAMVAGDDITHITPVIDEIVLKLLGLSDPINTVSNVERAVVTAYQKVRIQYAEDLMLAPIGMTMEAYLQNPEWLAERMTNVDLGCHLLVAGFDSIGDGHIFTVENPGIARNHDLAGWAAIGSGAFGSVGILLHHSVNWEMDLARVLYHVCESKFMAESAQGVGRHTNVMILNAAKPVKEGCELSEEFVALIRSGWETAGRPRIPHATLSGIQNLLKKGSFA